MDGTAGIASGLYWVATGKFPTDELGKKEQSQKEQSQKQYESDKYAKKGK